jgi:hypothetical protein
MTYKTDIPRLFSFLCLCLRLLGYTMGCTNGAQPWRDLSESAHLPAKNAG